MPLLRTAQDTRLAEALSATVRINQGTGIICDIPGYAQCIITAEHVIENSLDSDILIRHQNETHFPITVFRNKEIDIAVMYCSHKFPVHGPAFLDDGEQLDFTDDLWIIGYPQGWEENIPIVTHARIAGVGTQTWVASDCSWGSSGGPVVYLADDGPQLVGIVIGEAGEVHNDLKRTLRTLRFVGDSLGQSGIAKAMASLLSQVTVLVQSHFRTGLVRIAHYNDIIRLL